MNRSEYLYTKLAEECAEVIQGVSKVLIFGQDEVYESPENPDGLTNLQRLDGEITDVIAMLHILNCEGLVPDPGDGNIAGFDAKLEKVAKYMEVSEKLGTLDAQEEKE